MKPIHGRCGAEDMRRFFPLKTPYRKLQSKHDRMKRVYKHGRRFWNFWCELGSSEQNYGVLRRCLEYPYWGDYTLFLKALVPNTFYANSVCFILIFFLFAKHKHGKELRYKGLPNDEVYREIFRLTSAIGGMAYGSGSVAPPRSRGIQIEPPDPSYEDMSLGDDEETHMSDSQRVSSSDGGGSSINQRSRSIEK